MKSLFELLYWPEPKVGELWVLKSKSSGKWRIQHVEDRNVWISIIWMDDNEEVPLDECLVRSIDDFLTRYRPAPEITIGTTMKRRSTNGNIITILNISGDMLTVRYGESGLVQQISRSTIEAFYEITF